MTRQFMACMWLDDAQCAGVLPEAVGIFYKFNISIKGYHASNYILHDCVYNAF